MHIEIQNLFNQANHKNISLLDMGIVWKKLKQALDVPNATIDTYGAAIKSFSTQEKLDRKSVV